MDPSTAPPPPYYAQPQQGPPPPNTYGPQPYPPGPYMSAPQVQPIIINTAMMQQQQQPQQLAAPIIRTQYVTVRRSTNHPLCCLICFLTGGLSLPCWIYACITDDC